MGGTQTMGCDRQRAQIHPALAGRSCPRGRSAMAPSNPLGLRTLATATIIACFGLPRDTSAQDHAAIARDVLSATPLIDGHNDLPWAIRRDRVARGDVAAYDLRARTRGQTDIERLRRGRVGGQIWSVYVPCETSGREAARMQREQIDRARAMLARYPDAFGLARDADEVERIFRDGRIASLLGMEGGHALDGSLDALREFW